MKGAGAALLALLAVVAAAVAGAQGVAPVPRFKPSLEERANFALMSARARALMLRAVVEGLERELAEDPEDVEAWLRLGQARLALGRHEAAQGAFEQAVTLRPGSPSVLRTWASSLLGEPEPATGAPAVGADAAEVFRRLARLVPGDPEPHWYLGLAAVQAGAPREALGHWRTMLDLLDPEHPDYARIEARLEALEAEVALPRRYRPFAEP